MLTQFRKIASAVVLSKDGKILLGRKRPGKPAVYPDCWHIPGGMVEAGETLKTALARELKEETGLDISQWNVVLVDDQGSGEAVRQQTDGKQFLAKMQFFVFTVRITNKDAREIVLTESDDLINLQWFNPEELAALTLTPPSISLFKRLGYLKT